MRFSQNTKSHDRTSLALFIALCICVLSWTHASAQDYETNPNLKGVVVYDHNPTTHLGDDVFGTVVAEFREPVDGEYRCSHGGPVCMEYADGTLVAFSLVSRPNFRQSPNFALEKSHHPCYSVRAITIPVHSLAI